MKKHFIVVLCTAICLVLSVGAFTACSCGTTDPQKYTISFYAGETLVGTTETAGNEEIALPEAPQKEGFTFGGWYFDKDTWRDKLTKDTFAARALTENIVVYAYYIQNETPVPTEYTVTFYIGEDVAGTIETSGNEILVLPEAPPKDGYAFEGWFFDDETWQKELTADTYADAPLTENVNVYAYYRKTEDPEPEPPLEYTVTFDAGGGKPVAPMTTSRIDKEPQTTRVGYTFDGWYTDEAFLNKVTFPYEVTKAQTLYAKWTQNEPEGIVFTVDDGGVLTGVSGLTGNDITVEIPSEVNGIAVKEIGKDVFKDNKNIVGLVIPDSVTALGLRMCSGCTALREVQLPSGLTVIPAEAFDGCSSLQTINFPDTLRQISSDAFCGTALTEFTAPDSLTNIFGYAFKDCAALATVELNNVRKLGEGAFQNCTALQSIVLPDNVTELSGYIFDGCTSLAEIDMPDNDDPISVPFTLLYGTAYYNDSSNWENNVLYADGYLITVNKEFSSLTEYTVKEGTVVIADNAFSRVDYSSKLAKMTLPDGLYRIGSSAFSKLGKLTEINIPDTVHVVGYGAFASTGYDIESNYTDGGLYVDNWLVAVRDVDMTSFTVRDGTIGVADGKSDTSLFPRNAQKNVEKLTLPASLEYIGLRSFARLQKIEDLHLPSGLLALGDGAFASCSLLKTVNLGDCSELKSIGDEAFKEAAISEITIPKSVVSVGELVFNHNSVDLTIRCEVSERPGNWDENWSYSYNGDVNITVVWKNA